MSGGWDALAARARAMTAHLLPDERMRRLERADRLADVLRELAGTPYGPYLPPARDVSAASVETGLTRALGARMLVLARWSGLEGDPLAPVFLEQDARNLRAIFRGVVGALAPEQRLAGSIPTPSLGRRALEHLARAESVGAAAAALAAWGHPLGTAVLAVSAGARVNLFAVEAALDRGFAAAASRAGDGRRMTRFVADSLDARNVVAAMVLSASRLETDVLELFVEGGSALAREDFGRAASAEGPERAAEILERALRGTLFSAALAGPPFSGGAVASRVLRARMERLVREARIDPVSPVPVLLFVLRLGSEGYRLRRAVWAAAALDGVRP